MRYPFDDLSAVAARQLAAEFASPLYLICERTLTARYAELRRALDQHDPQAVVAYSYKTNPLRGVIQLLHRQGAWAEVVSGHEYQLARYLGVPGEQIVFNGPAKNDAELAQAVAEGAMINADHRAELERLAALGEARGEPVAVGIRIVAEAGGQAWGRFGFDWHSGEAWRCIEWLVAQPWLELAGFHCHLGTNIRDLQRYAAMAQLLAQAAVRVREQFAIELRWLDVGGGLAGISPRWDETQTEPYPPFPFSAYAETLLPVLKAAAPQARIICEPGRTLVDACGGLLMTVTGERPQNSWVLDGGINVSPTVRTYRHPLRRVAGAQHGKRAPVRLLGNSCMNHDCIHSQALLPPLSRGDLLLVHGLGAYNLSRTVPFIHLRPGAALWRGPQQAARWLRKPEDFLASQRLECDLA